MFGNERGHWLRQHQPLHVPLERLQNIKTFPNTHPFPSIVSNHPSSQPNVFILRRRAKPKGKGATAPLCPFALSQPSSKGKSARYGEKSVDVSGERAHLGVGGGRRKPIMAMVTMPEKGSCRKGDQSERRCVGLVSFGIVGRRATAVEKNVSARALGVKWISVQLLKN